MPTLPGFILEETDRVKLQPRIIAASVAVAFGDALVRTATAETLTPAAAGGTVAAIYWDADIASTDADYASTKKRMCYPVREDTHFRAPVESGTFTAANCNTAVDLASADGINMTTTSGGDFFIERFISSSVAIGRFVRREAE